MGMPDLYELEMTVIPPERSRQKNIGHQIGVAQSDEGSSNPRYS